MAYQRIPWDRIVTADPWLEARTVFAPGWAERGRPADQFNYTPTAVMDHHTACMCPVGHDPQSCLSGIIAGRNEVPGPISQVLGTFTPLGTRWTGSNVDPRVIIVASGRANHAGAGVWPPTIPEDEGNARMIGIEWCGPPDGAWPDAVIELRARLDAAVCDWYRWEPIQRVCTHAVYAPGRKIDPSGPWPGQPGIARLDPWNLATWQNRVAADPQEDDVPYRDWPEADRQALAADVANVVWNKTWGSELADYDEQGTNQFIMGAGLRQAHAEAVRSLDALQDVVIPRLAALENGQKQILDAIASIPSGTLPASLPVTITGTLTTTSRNDPMSRNDL